MAKYPSTSSRSRALHKSSNPSVKLKRHVQKIDALQPLQGPRLAKVKQKIEATTRPRRQVRDKIKSMRYVVAPEWGAAHKQGGGSWMEVTIGPLQGGPGTYGAPPASNTPPVMRKLLDGAHNSHGWIAGHLLNDNLGGPGTAENLTPLTTAGNKNHLNTCETKIKNFIVAAYSRTQNYPGDAHYYGVYYKVVVGDDKWDADDKDLKHVATELRVWAWMVKIDKLSGDWCEASFDDTLSFGATRFVRMDDVRVDNTGYDNLPVQAIDTAMMG